MARLRNNVAIFSASVVSPLQRGLVTAVLLGVAIALLPAAARARLPVQVTASIVPVQSFVQRIGGDRVEVAVVVKRGQSPATFEPTPSQMAALGDSRVLFRVGVPFEQAWIEQVRAASASPRVVDLREGIQRRVMASGHRHPNAAEYGHGEHDSADHVGDAESPDSMDPHIWTDPRNVMRMARRIRDALAAVDPQGRSTYTHNYRAFCAELEDLHAELTVRFSNLVDARFLVYHPAWSYFAAAYGLRQVAIEVDGKAPGPRTLARTIEQARREGIKVIFVQPGFSQGTARRVAGAIDAELVEADPLAADYVPNLRRVSREMAEAME